MRALDAMPAEQDFGDLAKLIPPRPPAGGELKGKLFKTGHLAAVDAHEVGMLKFMLAPRFAKLEPPDLVPEVELGEQTTFGQFLKHAIDRRLVEAEFAERVGHFPMAHWFAVIGQMAQHTHPRRRTAEAGLLQNAFGPRGIVFRRVIGESSHDLPRVNLDISSVTHLQVICKWELRMLCACKLASLATRF